MFKQLVSLGPDEPMLCYYFKAIYYCKYDDNVKRTFIMRFVVYVIAVKGCAVHFYKL